MISALQGCRISKGFINLIFHLTAQVSDALQLRIHAQEEPDRDGSEHRDEPWDISNQPTHRPAVLNAHDNVIFEARSFKCIVGFCKAVGSDDVHRGATKS